MGKNKLFYILWLILLIFTPAEPVYAQEDDYSVHVRKNFGSGFGSNIRGTFTISVMGDEEPVESVTFIIDGTEMSTITQPPFKYQFKTDDFGYGLHNLWASVQFVDGQTRETPAVQYVFLSPSAEREQVTTILLGLGAVVIVSMLIVGAVQFIFVKGDKKHVHQPGEPRNYGFFGGTICPKCGRPFPRHIWGMNLVVGRLDRCENCGKWVMTVRSTPSALRAAEEAERLAAKADSDASDVQAGTENILEESKYFDGL